MTLVKCLRMRIKVLFIARDTIIFSVKQVGLHLVVLLKIMVSPVLYQTIDTQQLLKTIPLFSKHRPYQTFTAGFTSRGSKSCPTQRLDKMSESFFITHTTIFLGISPQFHIFYGYLPEVRNLLKVTSYLISTLDKV